MCAWRLGIECELHMKSEVASSLGQAVNDQAELQAPVPKASLDYGVPCCVSPNN